MSLEVGNSCDKSPDNALNRQIREHSQLVWLRDSNLSVLETILAENHDRVCVNGYK